MNTMENHIVLFHFIPVNQQFIYVFNKSKWNILPAKNILPIIRCTRKEQQSLTEDNQTNMKGNKSEQIK